MTRHLPSPARAALLLAVVAVLAASLGACAAGTPSPSPSPVPLPSTTPVPGASALVPSTVRSAADAAAVALATDPRLAGIRPLDPNVIGASAWWEARRLDGGDWIVTVTIGWGDCQAGCIERHVWEFRVTADARATLEKESGPPLPSPLPG